MGIEYQRYKKDEQVRSELEALIGVEAAQAAAPSVIQFPVVVPPIDKVTQTASPKRQRTDGSTQAKAYGSQSTWGDRKAMSSQKVCITNTFLSITKSGARHGLTPLQHRTFWECVSEAMRHFMHEANRDNVPEAAAGFFNQKHTKLVAKDESSVGLGGMLRVGDAKALLAARGFDIRKAVQRLENPKLAPSKVGLTRAMVTSISHRELKQWCRALGKSCKATKAQMQESLLELFEGRPINHVMNPP